MQDHLVITYHFKRPPSLDLSSKSILSQKPQKISQAVHIRKRTYSISYEQNGLINRNNKPLLKHSNTQSFDTSNHVSLESLTSPIKTSYLKQNTIQQQSSSPNLQENLELNSSPNFVKPSISQNHGSIKTTEQELLNELEFDNISDKEERSGLMPKRKSIHKLSTQNTLAINIKNTLSLLPKSIHETDSSDDVLEAPWYSNFFQIKRYNFYWYPTKLNDQDIRPKGREGATLTIIGSKAYVYGGRSAGIMKELFFYRISKNTWKIPAVTGEIPRQGRAGHSTVAIKSSLWIFGGETEAPANTMSRVCLNSFVVFNTKMHQWNSVQARCFKDAILARKNHAVCVYEQIMLIYSGIGQLGEYFNDIWVGNTDSTIWKAIDIKESRFDEKGIAYHTICSVFQGKETLLKENQRRK